MATAATICIIGTLLISRNAESIHSSLTHLKLSLSPEVRRDREKLAADHIRRYTGEKCGKPGVLFDKDQNICQDMTRLLNTQRIYATDTPEITYLSCVPAKNGGTYHKSLMHRTRGVKDYDNVGSIHGVAGQSIQIERWENDQIGRVFLNVSIPKYAVVRNPLMRTLSGYLNRVESQKSDPAKRVDAFKKWAYETFHSDWLGPMTTWRSINQHWRPQIFSCGFQTFELNEHFQIFKFEESSTYVDYIYDHIPRKYLDSGWGHELNTSFRNFVLGPRIRTTGSADKVLDYYKDLDFFDHMAEALKDDIEVFGYEDEIARMRARIVKANAAEG